MRLDLHFQMGRMYVPDFVHDRDASFVDLFLKLLHGRADIACRDHIDLLPDGGLDDEGMIGVWDQADSH